MADIQAIILDNYDVTTLHAQAEPASRTSVADTLERPLEAIHEAINRLGRSDRAYRGELTTVALWREVLTDLGLDDCMYSESQIRKLDESYWGSQVMMVNAGLLEFVQPLRQRGVQIAMLSNAWDNIFWDWQYPSLDPRRHFDTTFISCEMKVAKPNAESFHYALRALRVLPSQALFVDDNAANVMAAQAIGMRAFLYPKSRWFDASIAQQINEIIQGN